MIPLQVKEDQISSELQSFHVGDVPVAGVEICESEQVLIGQRAAGFLQGSADCSGKARVRNGHIQGEGRGDEGGDSQGPNEMKNFSHAANTFVRLRGELCKGSQLKTRGLLEFKHPDWSQGRVPLQDFLCSVTMQV